MTPTTERCISLDQFQRVVLRLGNQMFVRHYFWLNYPEDPQLMGVQFQTVIRPRSHIKPVSCECGTCEKCQHREYMRKSRVSIDEHGMLHRELLKLGFRFNESMGLWTITRSENLEISNA